jgi:hypothetical protein
LAVQDRNKVCPKCFEVNDPAATFCIECGAPLSDDPASEGSDQEVYREITQANLHRISGDYKPAIDVCLAILKRFPNNGTAHTLLGDIYAEQGELEQAAQWFEMALDLRPESQNDRRKLEAVKRRMSEAEAASTAQQLGIPESKDGAQRRLYVTVMLVAFIGIASFLIGGAISKKQQPDTAPAIINDPIIAGKPDRIEEPPVQEEPTVQVPQQPVWPGNQLDQQIASLIATKFAIGKNLVSVHEDPRGPSLSITAVQGDLADPALVCVEFAKAVFAEFSSYAQITVLVELSGRVIFAADVTRADYQRVQTESLDPLAMLSRTWSIVPSDSSTATTGSE